MRAQEYLPYVVCVVQVGLANAQLYSTNKMRVNNQEKCLRKRFKYW